jgi:hypothetical protein
MGTAAKPTRDNRTITVDFRDETVFSRDVCFYAKRIEGQGSLSSS